MSIEMVKLIYEQNTVLPQDDKFYQRAIQFIEEDGISAQVYFLLKQQGRLSQTPSFFQQRLKESYDKGLFQNLLIKNQTDEILKVFEGNGIDVIALKGVYFAERYFGHIGARSTSDIDLLIPFKELDQSIESIKSLGFTVEEEKIPGHFHCSFSKKLPGSTMPLVVELHWNIVKENTSQFNINDLWGQAEHVSNFQHVKELSPNHLFYMICLHGWRHNLESMKYFLDIIQLIHILGNEIDYDKLLKLAASHKTLRRLKRTLSIVYNQFPHLSKVKRLPFEVKTTRWEYQRVKGLKQYADFLDYQFLSYDTFKHSIIELHHWFWPSKYDLETQIGVEQQGASLFKMYLSLYKKRITSMVKVFLPH
ncbi:nucleotidyltransferase family protein [Neobacillus drentensis]|uniref:nucleotidyltransferase domain-containing protein n=1 Tax=Neobacillus drentensis TaxID=220684 RepID=UPI003000A848